MEVKNISNNYKLKRVIVFTLTFLLYYSFANAQAYKDSDSLINIVENRFSQLSDTSKLITLEEIYKNNKLNPQIRLKYGIQSLAIAQASKNELWQFKSHFELGNIYKKKGDLDLALGHYFDALRLNQNISEISNEALVYASLSSTYRVSNDFDKSILYANKGIHLYRAIGDSLKLAISLMNTGEAYRINEFFDTALLYFRESGQIFDILNYKTGKAYNVGNIGLINAQMGNYKAAMQKLSEAIEILEKNKDFYPIIVYNLSMANIYQEQNKLDTAIKLVEDNLKIAQENDLKEQIKDANLKLSELYLKEADYKNAYHHQNQYLIYRDSINNEATIRKMADLRTDYEIAQKQIEVDLLEEEQKRQNIIFIGLVIIILLLVVLVFLYYRNYKRKQALNMIITERKEEAEAQRDQLEAINETKEKFLSIVSHDLLGPVNSFKGLSTIMKASIEAKDYKDLKQIHQLFDKSVNNLSSLLTNLLDWSVTQQGAIPYEPEKIVVSDLVNELLSLFSNMAATKNIVLQSTISDHTTVWADRNSLKAIFRNLVSNAIKFTQNKGEIILSNVVLDDTIGILVTDTGLGMPQEKIDQLLSKDAFSHSQGTSGEKGVGLGLQLVKEFTESNNGKLTIESTESEGTTITVYLPLRKAV
ncbi:MAG: two-component system NtrC family sensor kinase [Marivirga sp.]|jgi:two-component system NtrC family sensor kinase